MKKFYLFFAAALMALVSCSDDPETPVRVPEIVVNTPQITVDAEEASYSFAYEVVNPSSTGVLTVESSADGWSMCPIRRVKSTMGLLCGRIRRSHGRLC